MSNKKIENLAKSVNLYKKIDNMLLVNYHTQILRDKELMMDDHIISDITEFIVQERNLDSTEFEDDLSHNLKEDINNLFKCLLKLGSSTEVVHELEIDVQLHIEDGIKEVGGYIIDKTIVLIPECIISKEGYVKYNKMIYPSTKIVSNKEIGITLLFFEEIFKAYMVVKQNEEGEPEKKGELQINDDSIVGFKKLDGTEFKRVLTCIIEDKPLVPEIETVKCNFKDFVGKIFDDRAMKVSKVNEGERYKVGDIITHDGKILK